METLRNSFLFLRSFSLCFLCVVPIRRENPNENLSFSLPRRELLLLLKCVFSDRFGSRSPHPKLERIENKNRRKLSSFLSNRKRLSFNRVQQFILPRSFQTMELNGPIESETGTIKISFSPFFSRNVSEEPNQKSPPGQTIVSCFFCFFWLQI